MIFLSYYLANQNLHPEVTIIFLQIELSHSVRISSKQRNEGRLKGSSLSEIINEVYPREKGGGEGGIKSVDEERVERNFNWSPGGFDLPLSNPLNARVRHFYAPVHMVFHLKIFRWVSTGKNVESVEYVCSNKRAPFTEGEESVAVEYYFRAIDEFTTLIPQLFDEAFSLFFFFSEKRFLMR